MLCANPVMIGGKMGVVGCGQCIPCRINRRRVWVHRLMLEAAQWGDNAFVTLTYDDESLPRVSPQDSRGNLVPRDVQLFFKRLRKIVEPRRFRYYMAGEYGDESDRPHYHMAMFNFPTCLRGQTDLGPRGFRDYSRLSFRPHTDRVFCCEVCDLVHQGWGMGMVFFGRLEDSSANYIAGYVMKKMTTPDDLRLDGRHPEFARMSNRPGIGADAMHDVASVVLEFNLADGPGDVPTALRHGSRLLPLGRYLTKKLREYSLGSSETPPVAKAYSEAEVRRLREVAFDASRSIADVQKEETLARVRSIDARYKIFTAKRGKL